MSSHRESTRIVEEVFGDMMCRAHKIENKNLFYPNDVSFKEPQVYFVSRILVKE
jgi:hypothetical protein